MMMSWILLTTLLVMHLHNVLPEKPSDLFQDESEVVHKIPSNVIQRHARTGRMLGKRNILSFGKMKNRKAKRNVVTEGWLPSEEKTQTNGTDLAERFETPVPPKPQPTIFQEQRANCAEDLLNCGAASEYRDNNCGTNLAKLASEDTQKWFVTFYSPSAEVKKNTINCGDKNNPCDSFHTVTQRMKEGDTIVFVQGTGNENEILSSKQTHNNQIETNISFGLESNANSGPVVGTNLYLLNVKNSEETLPMLWILSTTIANTHISVEGFSVHIENSTFHDTVFTVRSSSHLRNFIVCNSLFLSAKQFYFSLDHSTIFKMSGTWNIVSLTKSNVTSISSLPSTGLVFPHALVSRVILHQSSFTELTSVVHGESDSILQQIHLDFSTFSNNLNVLSLHECRSIKIKMHTCRFAQTGIREFQKADDMPHSSIVEASNLCVYIFNSSFVNHQQPESHSTSNLLQCHRCTVHVDSSSFENNSFARSQAMLVFSSSHVTMTNCTFGANKCGCIKASYENHIQQSNETVVNSTLFDRKSIQCVGVILIKDTVMSMTKCTSSENNAQN